MQKWLVGKGVKVIARIKTDKSGPGNAGDELFAAGGWTLEPKWEERRADWRPSL
jgi:hypothetical protein